MHKKVISGMILTSTMLMLTMIGLLNIQNIYAAPQQQQVVVNVVRLDGGSVAGVTCTVVPVGTILTYSDVTNPQGTARIHLPASYTTADVTCSDGTNIGYQLGIFLSQPKTITDVLLLPPSP